MASWRRNSLYLSTIDPDAAALAEKYALGLEIAEYCTAMNMDEGFAGIDARVRGALARTGRAVLHGPFNELFPCAIDPKARALAAERYRQAIALAEGYGIRKIVLHGGFLPLVYYPQWFTEQSARFWKEFLRTVPEDVTICLENVLEDTPELLLKVAETVNDPRLRLCLDVGHVNAYSKIPAREWIRRCSKYLSHFHLHNNMGDRDSHSALFEGTLDMPELLAQIRRECPDATITLELPDAEASIHWLIENGIAF